jgi:hypothetical protein
LRYIFDRLYLRVQKKNHPSLLGWINEKKLNHSASNVGRYDLV